jgi:hypothetical protein
MARERSTSPRLNRDAARLVTLATALDSSGSRVEDRYWEAQLEAAITKLLRAASDAPLEAALEHLSKTLAGAYEVLIEQAETHSESTVIEKNGVRYDVMLLVAPLVAWTRYAIPTGPLSAATQEAFRAQLHGHILASDVRLSLMPFLVSVDQMPRTFSETWSWLQRLGSHALGAESAKPTLNADAEAANMLADTRYIVAAVAVPEGAPVFRWQETPEQSRESCLAQWVEQAGPLLATQLPGCGLECLLPDAYYVSNREADRRVRPLSLRAAVNWLEGALNVEADQLRAVIGGCGIERTDEYRISFTLKNNNDVYYGCVWPLYGREDDALVPEGHPDIVDEIVAQLKEFGVNEVRRIPGVLSLEYCEDCEAPYFPNPLGEMVHAELPEDADTAPARFH